MPHTINMGTRPIEVATLLPESVLFESEPWTSFYMTDEIVREFRKGLEGKARTGRNAPERLENHCLDEEASSRMDDEGCPNEPVSRSYFTEPFLSLLHRPLEGKAHDPGRESVVRLKTTRSQAEGI